MNRLTNVNGVKVLSVNNINFTITAYTCKPNDSPFYVCREPISGNYSLIRLSNSTTGDIDTLLAVFASYDEANAFARNGEEVTVAEVDEDMTCLLCSILQ